MKEEAIQFHRVKNDVVRDIPVLTGNEKRQKPEVDDIFEMRNERIVWVVDGVGLDAEGGATHHIQTVRAKQPEGTTEEDGQSKFLHRLWK